MNPYVILGIIAFYFLILVVIAQFTSKAADTQSFFNANRGNKWYLVAFGMIGTSLSGVTFISVPGQVGAQAFTYFQVVIGYVLGYAIIGLVLMPLYYKLNLVSIYGYLEQRFGFWSYKTGAAFFLISRSIGSAARFFLVVGVLQLAIFDALGVPFALTSTIALLLIWIYTYKGGIKTIVYTDTLQTFFMLASVVISFYLIATELDLSTFALFDKIQDSEASTIFNWDWTSKTYFWKQFFAGASIAVVMTGLDQDLMQKNLTCRNLQEAQKNMFWFTITLVIVNFLFLSLGAALYIYAADKGIAIPAKADDLFPVLAIQHFSPIAGVVFILGIIAATYASTDSALTALTTSFCIDFLNINQYEKESQKEKIKTYTHLGFTLLMLVIVLLFKVFNTDALITTIFKLAGYTYGPLLGLFAFGMTTKRKIKDVAVPFIAIVSPVISYVLAVNSAEWFAGYQFGFELLLINGLFTYIGLWAVSSKINSKEAAIA